MNIEKYCECGCGIKLKNQTKRFFTGHHNRSPEVKAKKAANFLAKHGVDNPSKLAKIKEKKKETNLKKFGAEFASQSEEIKQKTKEGFIKKYGVDNPAKLENIRKIISEKVSASREAIREKSQKSFYKTILKRLYDDGKMGTLEPLFDYNDYNGRLFKYPFRCKGCSSIVETNLRISADPLRCFTCVPKIDTGGQSILEREICDYVKTLDPNIKEQDRSIIYPLELDIISETHKVAIEINGLYWHSEISGRKNKFYHFQKQKTTNDAGYKLLQIFEDEWIEKQKIVKSRLKNAFGKQKFTIFARKCIVKEISTEIKSKFLKKYHIQGNDKSNIHLGLFYRNRLISVMTFNAYRIALGSSPKENCYELTRFCSNFNFSIIGGASKLLSYFEKKFKPIEITSYADCRWSDGKLYSVLEFKMIGRTTPNYWYLIKNRRKHRFAYRKSELPKLLKSFDVNLTEWDNMQLNGYDRIWDCGSLKFLKKF